MTPSDLLANVSNTSFLDLLANIHEVHNNFHVFDKTTSLEIIAFEITAVLFFIGSALFLRRTQKKIFSKLGVAFIFFLLFEMFTASMLSAQKLGPWAYVYITSSWITSMVYGTLAVWADYLTNKFLPKYSTPNFFVATGIMAIFTMAMEVLLISLGIRVYSTDTLASLDTGAMGIFFVYYSFIIALITISFYRYWNLGLDKEAIIPMKYVNLPSFLACFAAIISFDIMTETMVRNKGFWQWSYIYHDISVVLTLIGTIIIWLAIVLVNHYFNYFGIAKKFGANFLIAIAPVFALECYLINRGMRIYNHDTISNFSGLQIPIINMPVEVFFGSVFYLALVLPLASYIIFLINQNTKK